MVSCVGSAFFGMRAALEMLDMSAVNTANLNADGYKGKTVRMFEGKDGGVGADVGQDNRSGSYYLNREGKLTEASNVNYAAEAVDQITAKHQLSANATVLKAADEAEKSIIDIFA